MARTLSLRAIDYGNFEYPDAQVSGFAVNAFGVVNPPTASFGTITDLDYLGPYTASTNSYPLTHPTSSVQRSVDVDVKTPSYPVYNNNGEIVSGTETTIQDGAYIFTFSSASLFGFKVNNNTGFVSPPTASFGTIITSSYSTGYTSSTNTYPILPATSLPVLRHVTSSVEAPDLFWNSGSIVSGSLFTVQYPTGSFGTGSAWSVQSVLPLENIMGAGFGTQDYMGVVTVATFQIWSGSAWSTGTRPPGGNYGVASTATVVGAGLAEAGIIWGSTYHATAPKIRDYVQEWDGTSWSYLPGLPFNYINTNRQDRQALLGNPFTAIAGEGRDDVWAEFFGIAWSSMAAPTFGTIDSGFFGNASDAVIVGGLDGSSLNETNHTQLWNGVTWSTGTDYPNSPGQGINGSVGMGANSDVGIIAGGSTGDGEPGIQTSVQYYGGTDTYVTIANLPEGRRDGAMTGGANINGAFVGGSRGFGSDPDSNNNWHITF